MTDTIKTSPQGLPNPQSLPGLRSKWYSSNWTGLIVVAMVSWAYFGCHLGSELHFVDESAYVSQAYFADLWLEGRWDDPAWLSYAGFDLPPLPKYLIGLALKLEGYRRPGPSAMVAWYRDTSSQFVSIDGLIAARHPSVFFGVVGCLAIYAIGSMALDRRLGLFAAFLLMTNPLYGMHARRAMSDVSAEALILASLAVGLGAWIQILSGKKPIRAAVGLIFAAGILGGLATLSKLNGSLGGMILGAWALLATGLPGFRWPRKALLVVATLASGCCSFATFAALNPFLFAHPKAPVASSLAPLARLSFLERVKVVADHRVDVSETAKSSFPDDALRTPLDKVAAVTVQGFGRFGHFGPRGWTDSTIRFDLDQDRAAPIWLVWVTLGLGFAVTRGRRQIQAGLPPTAWAVATQAILALVVVTAFIPLAWDRYFLSIQPGLSLLGAFALVEGFDRVRPVFGRPARREVSP